MSEKENQTLMEKIKQVIQKIAGKRIVVLGIAGMVVVVAGVVIAYPGTDTKEKSIRQNSSMFGVNGKNAVSYVTATGTTSLGYTMDEFEPDYIESELYIEEVYVSSGDEVNEGTAVFKIAEESIQEAREELTEKKEEASLAYRAGLISYEQSKINAKYTYDTAILEGQQAEAVYQSALKDAEEKLEKAREEVTETEKKIEEYENANAGYYYDYHLDTYKERYEQNNNYYYTFLGEFGFQESDLTGSGAGPSMGTGNQGGMSGNTGASDSNGAGSNNTSTENNSGNGTEGNESGTEGNGTGGSTPEGSGSITEGNTTEGSGSSTEGSGNTTGGSTTGGSNTEGSESTTGGSTTEGSGNTTGGSTTAGGESTTGESVSEDNGTTTNLEGEPQDNSNPADDPLILSLFSDSNKTLARLAANTSLGDGLSLMSVAQVNSNDENYTRRLGIVQQMKKNKENSQNYYYKAWDEYEAAANKATEQVPQLKIQIELLRAELLKAEADYQIEILEAETTYKKALAQTKLAQSDYNAAIQKAEDELEALEDEKTETRENLEEFEVLLGDGYFYTKNAGTIMVVGTRKESNLQGGSMVVAYRNTEDISVTVSVAQEDIHKLEVGDSAQVMVEGYGTFEGKITYLNPVSNSGSRTNITYEVIVDLNGENISSLKENLTATVIFG